MAAAMIACHGCGTPTPAHLIDAKPPPGANPETADWSVLHCQRCYGPGWQPLHDEKEA